MRCVSYEFHMILQRWFVSWTGWTLSAALSYSSLFDAIRCPKFTRWVSLIRLKRLFEVHIPTCSAVSAADPLYRAAIFSTILNYSELLVWEARRHVNNELHLAYIAGYIEKNIEENIRTEHCGELRRIHRPEYTARYIARCRSATFCRLNDWQSWN